MKYLQPLYEALGKRDTKNLTIAIRDSRVKNIKNLKNLNYHLLSQRIKAKKAYSSGNIDGFIYGAYELRGDYKINVYGFDKDSPVSLNISVSKAKWNAVINSPSIITPSELTTNNIEDQYEMIMKWFDQELDIRNNIKKQKMSSDIDPANPRKFYNDVLKPAFNKMITYGSIEKDSGMIGIELTAMFQPTIAKFKQEVRAQYVIDLNTMTFGSSKYDDIRGNLNIKDSILFTNGTDLIKQIRKAFSEYKKDTINSFNSSDANDWKY